MTNPISVDFFNRQFLGFDDLIRAATRSTSAKDFPPHNVIRVNQDLLRIEQAVAGFSRDELEVSLDDRVLTVTGRREETESDPEVKYIYRGLSSRNFERKWTLARHWEVKSVTLTNGVLTIDIEHRVPESEKPRLLEIQ